MNPKPKTQSLTLNPNPTSPSKLQAVQACAGPGFKVSGQWDDEWGFPKLGLPVREGPYYKDCSIWGSGS